MSDTPKDHAEPPGPVKWLIWLFRIQTWKDQPLVASIATILVLCATVTGVFALMNLKLSDSSADTGGSGSPIVNTDTSVTKSPGDDKRYTVILMDSTFPAVVYDPETRKAGGTNADDISDAIDDLPLNIIKETTNLDWDRDEQVYSLDPDLIIIHLSAFYSETNPGDSDGKLTSFLKYMAASRAKFIFYSRVNPERSVAAINQQFPFFRGRVSTFAISGGGAATFRDKTTARNLKILVKDTLGITN